MKKEPEKEMVSKRNREKGKKEEEVEKNLPIIFLSSLIDLKLEIGGRP